MKPAVFLDRDGVLIEDVDLLQRELDIHVLEGVPEALNELIQAGFRLIIISNQPVVARGLLTEEQAHCLHHKILCRLNSEKKSLFQASYFCFHHPEANLPQYRLECECRKPNPGLLLKAAQEHGIDRSRSFFIGDRITDILAGARAGLKTILVKTGAHLAPPIRSSEPLDPNLRPDYECQNLQEAAYWIRRQKQ